MKNVDGPRVTYVQKQSGEFAGFSEEGLVAARDMVAQELPNSRQLISALERVIDSEPGPDVLRQLRAEQKYLFGAYRERQHQLIAEGFLFAEGAERDDSGAYSVIRMGLWVVAAKNTMPGSFMRMTEQEHTITRKALVKTALSDQDPVDGNSPRRRGVPVSRYTRVYPLHLNDPEYGMPYVFGHRQDLEAIEELEVPEPLKDRLRQATSHFHENDSPV